MNKSGRLFEALRFKKLFFSLLALLLTVGSFSQNLITNGDFESGGPGTGFDVNGAGYVNITPPPPLTGTSAPGNYAFLTNPQPMNTAFFLSFGDHTSGTGRMMVIDGNTTGGAQRFWRLGNTGGGVCGLTVGATYTFSYWIRSASSTVTDVSTQADIGIQVNNAAGLTLTGGSTRAPLPAAGWQKVTYTFQPTNACINIELWNNNTNPVGNDFAVDDFELLPPPTPLSISYSVSNVTCPGANDGAIVVYGIGGIKPYTSYSLTGSATQTNTTGIFTGLAPGTYNISITDNNSATASANGLIITQPANIDISPTFAQICSGIPVTLTASGAPTYSWTAVPADPTLVTPNNPVITVTPAVTTIYTVTSNTSTTRELLFNGNFSLGNVGFSTDYQYLNPTNPSGAQRAYGIVPNSQAWWNTFANCTGRGGAGNMMVADGSTFNLGNDRVWCQTIPVKPGQNYTFSYWVQSLTSNNLANLEVTINGVSVGAALAPAATCTWQQRTYVWNSGASTTAQICIYDRVTQTSGNDFALDDLSFTTSVTCNLSASVTVVVNGATAVTGFSYPSPVCADAANLTPVTVPGFTTGGTFSSIAGLSINPSTGVINVGASTPGIYTVTYTVAPSGCNGGGSSTASVTIRTLPVLGSGSIVHPPCAGSSGSFTVTMPVGANFQYNINGSAFQNSPVFSGLAPGNYIVRVRDVSTGCISAATSPILPIVINPPPVLAGPQVVVTAPTCPVPFGTITVTSPLGPNLEYSINNVNYQSSPVFTGLTPFTVYNVTYRNTLNGCVSLTTDPVIPALNFPPAPTASVTVQPTCTAPTGVVVITAPLGANLEYSTNGTTYQTGTTFSGLAPGTYNLRVRNTSTLCVSNLTAVTVNPLPPGPPPPTASVTVQPTCSTPQPWGTIVITAPIGAGYEYSYDGTLYQLPTTFMFVPPGTWNVTVREIATGCISAPTTVVVNNPAIPNAPAASVTVQPTCANPSGTIVVASPLGANLEYSINGVNYQSSPTFTGVAPGTYDVRVRSTVSFCVSPQVQVTVNPVPAAPPAATSFIDIFPNCISNLTVIRVSAPIGPLLRYSINGGAFQAAPVFSTNLGPGTYVIRVQNSADGCISAPASITVPPPVVPAVPAASVTVQPTCAVATGTIVITSPVGATLQYSINGVNYQSSPTFTGVAPGTYNVTVRNTANFCISAATSVTVNTAPAGLAAPAASVLQPTCIIATGAINVTNPLGLNFEYSIDGTSYQSNPSFINLVPGLYNVTVRSTSTGCVSLSTPVKIDLAPVSPNPPVVSSPVNYCLNESTVPLTANGTNLLWYTTATGGTGSTSAPRPSSSAEGNTTYYVSQTVNGCESQRTSITVSVKPLPIANAGFDKKIFPGQPVQLNGTTNSVTNTAFWTPNVNITNANTFTPTVAPLFSLNYTLTVTSVDGCTAKDIANVVVLKEPIIPNVFSPNNDGMNDRWVIRNLDLYDNIRVEIFNRYGERVYESRSYNSSNAWDGTYKGNPLPVGAYFYVIQLNNGKEPLKGSISIVR